MKNKETGNGLKIGLIIVGVIVVLQVVVLVGLIFRDQIFANSGGLENEETAEVTPELSYIYELETIQVNLAADDNSSRNHFLRTTLNLAYGDSSHQEVIEQNLVQIQALLIDIFRLQSISDIDTVEKTNELGTTIQSQLNDLLGKEMINGIYFVEFIWQ